MFTLFYFIFSALVLFASLNTKQDSGTEKKNLCEKHKCSRVKEKNCIQDVWRERRRTGVRVSDEITVNVNVDLDNE